MGEVKAVIFDMDGVLIDARDWHYEALNLALGLFGYQISRFDHLVTYDGLPTSRKLEMLTLERGLPAGLHAFINEMKQLYTLDQVHAHCRPRFNHEYALSRLRADGLRIAVASNSIRSTIDLMMSRSGLDGYLDFVLSNQDVTRPKPDPEIYCRAMERLGLPPAQCLVVEDNVNGVKAARASGAHVMVVSSVHDVDYEQIRKAILRAEEVE